VADLAAAVAVALAAAPVAVAAVLGASEVSRQLYREKRNTSSMVEGASMSRMRYTDKSQGVRIVACMTVAALTVSLSSCKKSEDAQPAQTTSASPAEAGATQRTFASPAEAGAAFVAAAKSGDQAALLSIFGPGAKDVLFTGDPVKDKDALQDFVAAYGQMNRWNQIKPGGDILYIGADNYPFPIPLAQNSSGQWSFDTAAGRDEILARRIGKGELMAIAASGATATAEQQYHGQPHGGDTKQYAQKLVSDAGTQDGLYWEAADGQAASPLGPLVEFAKAVGYTNAGEKPQPFNGYYFRILTKQGDKAPGGAKDYIVSGKMTGGFAVLAYPAEYRNSGIMTFIVGKDGVIYQKDLGEKTTDLAAALSEYNPGDGWSNVNARQVNKPGPPN
jgi:Protein of unknown function (DUF2950)